MKSRRVIVSVELETEEPLSSLQDVELWRKATGVFRSPVRVLDARTNVVRAPTAKRARKKSAKKKRTSSRRAARD